MYLLSLVITTQNRKKELLRFLDSLDKQQGVAFNNIQIIFIDQGNNEDVIYYANRKYHIEYIPYCQCALSQARNVALNYVKGKYVAFPDDDCWYTPLTLSCVFERFNQGFDGVVAFGCDEDGKQTNKFPSKSCLLSKYKHCGAISYTLFLKFDSSILFDENIGVGSKYNLSSGEETDYLVNYFNKEERKVLFDKDIVVHHPNGKADYFGSQIEKSYYYARGDGYILKKHHFPCVYKLKCFVRPICGIILNLIIFRTKRAERSFFILKGRIEGYRMYSGILCK